MKTTEEMITGFYGKPGTYVTTKVHCVYAKDETPLCGIRINKRKMKFQFCAMGCHTEYITCERCKQRYAGVVRRAQNDRDKKLSKS